MRGMTDGATEAVATDVGAVFNPAGVRQHLVEVVTLGAQGVRSIDAAVGIGEGVGDQSAGHRRLAELVVALQDV